MARKAAKASIVAKWKKIKIRTGYGQEHNRKKKEHISTRSPRSSCNIRSAPSTRWKQTRGCFRGCARRRRGWLAVVKRRTTTPRAASPAPSAPIGLAQWRAVRGRLARVHASSAKAAISIASEAALPILEAVESALAALEMIHSRILQSMVSL